jgi:hypothetical protein
MAKLSDYIAAMIDLGGATDETVTEDEVFALLARDEREQLGGTEVGS